MEHSRGAEDLRILVTREPDDIFEETTTYNHRRRELGRDRGFQSHVIKVLATGTTLTCMFYESSAGKPSVVIHDQRRPSSPTGCSSPRDIADKIAEELADWLDSDPNTFINRMMNQLVAHLGEWAIESFTVQRVEVYDGLGTDTSDEGKEKTLKDREITCFR
jgi:hypothetical protein